MFQIRSRKRIKSFMWIILSMVEPINNHKRRTKEAVNTAFQTSIVFKTKETFMKTNLIVTGALKTLVLISIICLSISGANARSLKANTKHKPWLGCCKHCSSIQCSGCSETTPLQAGGCNFIANCTTKNDETKCKPSSSSLKKLRKLKAR